MAKLDITKFIANEIKRHGHMKRVNALSAAFCFSMFFILFGTMLIYNYSFTMYNILILVFVFLWGVLSVHHYFNHVFWMHAVHEFYLETRYEFFLKEKGIKK